MRRTTAVTTAAATTTTRITPGLGNTPIYFIFVFYYVPWPCSEYDTCEEDEL